MTANALERDVRRRVKAALTKHGFHFHSAVAGAYSKVGVEDDTACIHGRYVATESKNQPTDKPTAMQIRNAKSVLASGGIALLVHHGNIEAFERWVEAEVDMVWLSDSWEHEVFAWPDQWR